MDLHEQVKSLKIEEGEPDKASDRATAGSDSHKTNDDSSEFELTVGSLPRSTVNTIPKLVPPLRGSFVTLDEEDSPVSAKPSPSMFGRGLLPFGDNSRSRSAQGALSGSALGVRSEQSKLASLESENFQLKLKVRNMEQHCTCGFGSGSSGELDRILSDRDKLKAKVLELESRLDRLSKQHRSDDDEELKELDQRLALVEETLNQTRQDRDELAEELRTRKAEEEEIVANVNELIDQLVDFDYDFIPNSRVDTLVQAFQKLAPLTLRSLAYADELENELRNSVDRLEKASAHEQRTFAANGVIADLHDEYLPEQIAAILQTNRELQAKMDNANKSKAELEERLSLIQHQASQESTTTSTDLAALQKENQELSRRYEEANKRSYSIVRIFFRRLSTLLGSEYMARINQDLSDIVAQCERTGSSKLPLLSNLMSKYVDELCKIVIAKTPGDIVRELHDKNKNLEGILIEELKLRNADEILLSRYNQLKNEYKILEEKRQVEYEGYQAQLASLSS